jgi:DNA-directed RNA polymerase subunit M/transcription elongation factor TFIIS
MFSITDKINLDNYGLSKDFITDNSKDINRAHIVFALDNINRAYNIIKINDVIIDIKKSIAIEMGIFEYALVMATLNNFDKNIIPAIYNDKLDDILLNLNVNSYLKNKSLYNALNSGVINPNLVAFMAPDQMHPESWSVIINKIKYKEDKENTMATTDMYRCRKCGERRCKVTELQMRSADEPTSKVITCLVCYTTFIK